LSYTSKAAKALTFRTGVETQIFLLTGHKKCPPVWRAYPAFEYVRHYKGEKCFLIGKENIDLFWINESSN
jgi:hypothetical protein